MRIQRRINEGCGTKESINFTEIRFQEDKKLKYAQTGEKETKAGTKAITREVDEGEDKKHIERSTMKTNPKESNQETMVTTRQTALLKGHDSIIPNEHGLELEMREDNYDIHKEWCVATEKQLKQTERERWNGDEIFIDTNGKKHRREDYILPIDDMWIPGKRIKKDKNKRKGATRKNKKIQKTET